MSIGQDPTIHITAPSSLLINRIDVMSFTLLPPVPASTTPLSDSWLSFIDKTMTGLSVMCKALVDFKASLPGVASHSLSQLCELPRYKNLNTKVIQAQLGPVNWDNLDRWIVEAIDKRGKKLHNECIIMASVGITSSNIIRGENPSELIAKHPIGKMSEFLGGPNWASCFEQYQSISPYCAADSNGIPMSIFSPRVLMCATKIYDQWHTLKMEASRKLSIFKDEWASLAPAARIRYLEDKHRYLPRYPHGDLYAWAHDPKWKELFFRFPSLNIEDLCQDGVFPKLLQVRQALHPALFRSIDGSLIPWGIWCGGLKQVRVKGRFSFPFETESYGISLQDGITDGPDSGSNFNQARAIIALHQLEAQDRLYTFLLDVLQDVSGLPKPEEGIVQPLQECGCDEYPTILARCARESISRAPDTIDLEYIGSLVEASLDEIHHDFRQLRENADSWSTRVINTSGLKRGKAINLLHSSFSRIDFFHSLKNYLDVQKDCWRKAQDGSTISVSLENREAFKSLVSIHVALQGTLNELLCSLKDIKWQTDKLCGAPFSRLFDIMKTNDPCLRVMGISRVLRVIDEEIKKAEAQATLPPNVSMALTDISVMAACLEETSNHYKFASNTSLYATVFSDLVAEWKMRPRPYMLIAEKTIQAMSKHSGKLNVLIQNEKEILQSRHIQYWKFVDECMPQSSQDSEVKSIIGIIQQTGPISSIETVHSSADFASYTPIVPQPTLTQIKRSRRKPIEAAPPSPEVPISSVEKPSRPAPVIIRPDTNLAFWKALLENRSEVSWTDFCSAMIGIGYNIYGQGGACYRFEGPLGVIVFHRPHGGDKVNHEYAHTQWLRRINDRFTVVVD